VCDYLGAMEDVCAEQKKKIGMAHARRCDVAEWRACCLFWGASHVSAYSWRAWTSVHFFLGWGVC